MSTLRTSNLINGSSSVSNIVLDTEGRASFGPDGPNGRAALYVDAQNNRVGVNNESPSTTLDVDGAINTTGNVTVGGTLNLTGDLTSDVINAGSGTAAAPSVSVGTTDNGLYSPGTDQVAISTNGTERLQVDSSGRLLVGTSSVLTTDSGHIIQASHSTGSKLTLGRSSTSIASGIGIAQFIGYSNGGDVYEQTGSIGIFSDGTHASGDKPGRLVFSTTADGASSPTERLRIDSSGNVGIGTTSPDTTLTVVGTSDGVFNLDTTDTRGSFIRFKENGVSKCFVGCAEGLIGGDQDDLGLRAVDNILFASGGSTERMRIDSSGNVGIGDSAPNGSYGTNLSVYSTATDGARLKISDGTSGRGNVDGLDIIHQSGIAYIIQRENNDIRISTNNTERMRIDGSGRLLVGTSSTTQAHTIQAFGATNCLWVQGNTPTSEIVAVYGGTASGNNIFIKFLTDSLATRGTIDYNRSAGQVRYNTTSDARLKSEIADSTTALSTLNNIRVRKYKWTETDYQVEHGFVAQELTGVVPEAVKVGDDGDEVTDVWAVDNSKLVPLLTKALQEAITKIETLEQRLSDAGIT